MEVARHSAGSRALAPVTAVVDLCASLCKLALRVLLISFTFAGGLLVLASFPRPPKKMVLDEIFRFLETFPKHFRNRGLSRHFLISSNHLGSA